MWYIVIDVEVKGLKMNTCPENETIFGFDSVGRM